MRTIPAVFAVILVAAYAGITTAASPASPELCRAGISCAEHLWREETFELAGKAGGPPFVIQLSIPGGAAPESGGYAPANSTPR